MSQRKAFGSWCVLAVCFVAFTGFVARAASLSCVTAEDPGIASPPVLGYSSTQSLIADAGAMASPTVPSYSSLPGAPHTLYLNFGGINYSGTWDGQTPGNVPAYSIDSDSSTFSATELSNIQQIWGRVSEAYSPFNVNVTTVAPGSTPVAGQWSQIVIGAENSSGTDWYAPAGGVAYVNGFAVGGQEYGTGWAFTNYLGNGNPKVTAIAATHEAGHQFGLDHQRLFDANGNLVSEYRDSSDGELTAPIMGVAYYSIRALWSNGTSASATSDQLDTSILASTLGYRPDDNNNDIAHAKPLTVTDGTSVSASGVIKTPTENDLFSFATGSGQVTLHIVPSIYGGMLDSKLLLYRRDGTLLQTIDPALTSTGSYGLDATYSGYLSAGTYYLGVASHGGYGDLGQYAVTGSIAVTTVPEPSAFGMAVGTVAVTLVYRARKRLSRLA